VTLRGRDEGERDARITARRFDQRRFSWRNDALLLERFDHRNTDAVLHTRDRIEEFELQEDVGLDARLLGKAHQRRVADGLGDGVIDASTSWLAYFHTCLLDREVGGAAAAAVDALRARPLTKIFYRNRVQPRHHFVLKRLDQRRHDADAEIGTRIDHLGLFILETLGHAHDIAYGNPPPLLGQAIPSARTAHALEHAGAHKLLHDLLEIALRHTLAGG